MIKTVNGVEFAFRWCPSGTFMMGGEREEWNGCSMSGKSDSHEVTLSEGFWLLETEVTREQWQAIMENNPSHFKGDNLPVEQVSWNDCQKFCKKFNSISGLKIDLPTEAQWEYACRAGTTTVYSFGSSLNGDSANCNGNYSYGTTTKGKYLAKTTPVGSYSANAWGLYDMHGNVREWCSDWYSAYSSGSVTDPTGADRGTNRVLRGGSWYDYAGRCQSAYRDASTPDGRYYHIGFRPVLVSFDMSAKTRVPAVAKTPVPGTWRVETVKGVEFAFCWCPPGAFVMGSPETEEGREPSWGGKETPHHVTLTEGFGMQETEVTQAQWKTVMGSNPSSFKGDDLPVENVSWMGCQEFCRKCKDLGLPVQLPTEAQWEYACRAGSTTRFSFGDSDNFLYKYCNYCDKSNVSGYAYQDKEHTDGYDKTAPVKSLKPNAWGLYDMHGNVWEWCNDWCVNDLTSSSVTDPKGPESGLCRIFRGGSWHVNTQVCRSALRGQNPSEYWYCDVGFRLSLGQ